MKIPVFQALLVLSFLGELLQGNTHGGFALSFEERTHEEEYNDAPPGSEWPYKDVCKNTLPLLPRPHSVSIKEFGAVGDGVTLNTQAFQNAMYYVRSCADKGGAQLYVPGGRWLTGSFNLTSHLTLFLHKDAVILGSEDPRDWPVIDPLPSYGRGRELPGGRHISLIHGENLRDVIITGDNGTVDGQGAIWWEKFGNKTLDYTRGNLLELVNSCNIVISNLTFLNSPFWTIHPVYCRNVLIQNLTILAPHDSPNTDGIDPDSSSHVCIEDCFISTGDDLIAIKSGWDEYGISYKHPSSNIIIRRVTGETRESAGIAIGSELSGGVSKVFVKDMLIYNAGTGIRIKTSVGRGGYVKKVLISNIKIINAMVGIQFTGLYGQHPDTKFDPNALTVVKRILIENVVGENVSTAGNFLGVAKVPFTEIFLRNVSFHVTNVKHAWNCSNVRGFSDSVFPEPCPVLQNQSRSFSPECVFSKDTECKNL